MPSPIGAFIRNAASPWQPIGGGGGRNGGHVGIRHGRPVTARDSGDYVLGYRPWLRATGRSLAAFESADGYGDAIPEGLERGVSNVRLDPFRGSTIDGVGADR